MRNGLAVFIIALIVLSVTIPLNTVDAQVIVEDRSDPFDDDIVIIHMTFVLVLSIFGLVIVLVIVVIIMYRRFGRLPSSISKDK